MLWSPPTESVIRTVNKYVFTRHKEAWLAVHLPTLASIATKTPRHQDGQGNPANLLLMLQFAFSCFGLGVRDDLGGTIAGEGTALLMNQGDLFLGFLEEDIVGEVATGRLCP
ncbi:hypothetical protein THAOC_23952 [Thalassiosira oceanica]|uniref:Uncharacterized protein n=1 Tax=Thalassiosira oceanica TaxID=159749 RepID=K0RUY5_THAOC|nr:hypothetical protein THAOC_23952 [Thalassiosira oceanica]|eukprot:EJK56209.1 hypothetical protein THAOC_23952 [Thalassiosira oceanica]